MNAHASTLNTLLARGKTKRATRTSTSYEASRTQHVSLSFLGNGHPGKLIPMERNLEGQHTAATKERFLLCVDVSVPRHESLSPDMLAADDSLPAWTWLPLTPLQAAIFGWTGILNNPGHFEGQEPGLENDEEGDEGFPAVLPDGVRSRIRYVYDSAPAPAGPSVAVRTEWRISRRWQVRDQTEHIQAGARRVCEYFAKRPHKTLELTDGAQKLLLGNQVAQSIRATNKDGQASMEALRANAAHQQGMMSAAVAILELAAGGGSLTRVASCKLLRTTCRWRPGWSSLACRSGRCCAVQWTQRRQRVPSPTVSYSSLLKSQLRSGASRHQQPLSCQQSRSPVQKSRSNMTSTSLFLFQSPGPYRLQTSLKRPSLHSLYAPQICSLLKPSSPQVSGRTAP
ncbi:unnamed protein product [Effrenium voratum]|nr:unnamed protein product [Effrenium voratum]